MSGGWNTIESGTFAITFVFYMLRTRLTRLDCDRRRPFAIPFNVPCNKDIPY